MRRRYRWGEIAASARAHPGVWRMHPDLISVNADLRQHAARRVRALQPGPDGHYEFRRANVGPNHLGHTVFDLKIRFVPTIKENP